VELMQQSKVRMSPRQRGVELFLYWGGGVLLVPWIVVLYLNEPSRVVGVHITLLRGGIAVFICVGILSSVLLVLRRSVASVVTAMLTATVALVAAWFLMVGANHRFSAYPAIATFAVYLPVMFVMWSVAVSGYRSRYHNWTASKGVATMCWLLFGLALAFFLVSFQVTNDTMLLHRMRLAWSGLDVMEMAGVLATGSYLYLRSSRVALSASFTSALLFCDAWYNIVATHGATQISAIAMAFVEIPGSLFSLYVALREVYSWQPELPRQQVTTLWRLIHPRAFTTFRTVPDARSGELRKPR
jgi:hypothetical protein